MKRIAAAVVVGLLSLFVIGDIGLTFLDPGIPPGGGEFGTLQNSTPRAPSSYR